MAPITQILNKGVSLSDDLARYLKACGKTSVLQTKPVNPTQLKGIKIADNVIGDTINITKSPLGEFSNYMQGVAREGKGFKPILENPNSPFAKYLKSIEDYNLAESKKTATNVVGFKILAKKPKSPNIVDFKDFLYKNAETMNISKEEYWQIVDEVAKSVKQDIVNNPYNLRKEFIEHSDKIHKWAEIFRTQHFENGKNIYHKYYDEKLFNKAVKEYTEFVESITGKKVLIGCPSRMNFPISALGMLNNPKAYEGVDYILLGHGKNSSLITDITHPNTWRFSDNNQSIWKYLEDNVPKGKKAMVFCCEVDGLAKAKSAGVLTEDGLKQYEKFMLGIGKGVDSTFRETAGPVKICESGVRHIKGHIHGEPISTPIGSMEVTGGYFSLGGVKEPLSVSYDDIIDLNKYRV